MVQLLRVACFLAATLINLKCINAAKKSKECLPFPYVSLDNGEIVRASHQKYVFKCDSGYFLASPPMVRCFRGNWTSHKEPKCLKKQGLCEDPPAVSNAVVLGEERDTGSTIRYSCKPGFLMVGKADMICTRSGHWDGRVPTCMEEKEPLQKVSHRLKNSFVSELGSRTEDAPEGRLLDPASTRHGLDLVLLIDRSSSVDPVYLEITKNFVNFLLKRFGVRNEPNKRGGTQAAVLTFGTEVQMVFNMDNYNITGPLAASDAVGTIQPNGGGTNIEGALTMVVTQVSTFLRKKSKKALFLMTDGEPNIGSPGITVGDFANTLRNELHFEIFTVGIGREINRNVLADIASKPPLSHVFILSEYTDLNEIMTFIEKEPPPDISETLSFSGYYFQSVGSCGKYGISKPISKSQCGYEVPSERSPWHAVIYISGGGGLRNMRMCGGVLICSQWVLTAASCLLEGEERIPIEEVFVTLGDRDILLDDKNQTNFYVLDIKLHDKFDPSEPLHNNLALVKLNSPTHRYRPICLPRSDTNMPLYQKLNANVSISGWGLNAAMPTHPSGASVRFKLSSSLVSLAEEDECPGNKPDLPLFCAGQGVQTCLGLMGSPITAMDPETHLNHVLGVIAGRSYCLKGHNQYVELTKHLHWINLSTKHCHQKQWD